MKKRIDVYSEAALVVVSDVSTSLPAGTDQDALLAVLEPMARSSKVFFLVTDDPVRCRIDMFSNEPPPSSLEREFEPHGGTFRLDIPSGRVAVRGWSKGGEPAEAGAIEVRQGAHLLSVMARRPFDSARHVEDMAELLGAEWTFMERVDKLGLVGCLPFALTVIGIFAGIVAGRWQWLGYVLPALALTWLPYMVLRHTRRYKDAQRRASEEEQARPDYVLRLTPTDRDGLTGGFLRV